MAKKPSEIDPLGPAPKARPHGRLYGIRRTVMAGISVIAPLAITGFVLWTLFNWLDKFSRPLIRPLAAILGDADWYHRGVGFALTLIILWVVGVVTTNVVGRRLLQEAREALERLPLVRTIYAPIRQLLETMTSPEGTGFKQVILFEYPRKGTWTLAFVAGDVPFDDGRRPAHSVFVPTAPNPTTGFMLIVSSEDMRATNLTVEEAFQMIVSAGVVVPVSLQLPASIDVASQEIISGDTIAAATPGDAT